MTARLFALYIFLFFAFFSAPAPAQNKEVNDLEKAVFSYFALSGTQPDYNQWIRSSQKYKNASKTGEGESYYEAETLRLKWGFGTFDPNKDFIRLRTPVKIFLQSDGKNATLFFAFSAENPDTVPYFPFPYGNQWIAFVAQDLDKFLSVPVTPEQFAHITRMMTPNAPHPGAVMLRFKATSADTTAPMPMEDGFSYWLMMGETGYIELLYTPPKGPEMSIWSYEAPWFLTDTEKELYPLIGQ